MMTIWLVLAVQIATPTPDPVPTSAPIATKPVPEKKLCRQVETTGSIMGQRTCRTKAEWAAIDAANRRNVDQSRDRRSR